MTRKYSAIGLLFLSTVIGCGGPSTEDLMMRAAMRSRGRDDEKAADKMPVDNKPSDGDSQSESINPPATTAPARQIASKLIDQTIALVPQKEKPVDVLDTLSELAIEPISERKPKGESDKDSRRKQSAENLRKIADALQKFHSDKGYFPASAVKTKSGVSTLSWRVELLPYLGYADLYKKFDPTRPWNYEPNQTLLQYIPDEFISPERYDVKTNYQLPVASTFMFEKGKARKRHDVDQEDGSENTIMLLEVNDNLAVEWTKPADYTPSNGINVKNDLGALRGDGTFAVWANGWTVLLANGLSNQQIFNALTFDAGDGQRAGEVHRDIPLAEPTVASAADNSAEGSAENRDDAQASMLSSISDVPGRPIPTAELRAREKLPIAGDLAKAQSRLREIFRDKIVQAKKDDEKSQLADEMLDISIDMTKDASGAYALQQAAIHLSSEAGELQPILRAIDQRVSRFEIDAYEENMSALLRFAESTTRREPEDVDGDEFVRRSVAVIFAAISDDDYVRASALARHSYRLLDQEPDDEMMKSLNRLRVLLSSAQREYDKASVGLANYRDDPDRVDDAATFGRFLCFIKGDWDTGLPLVAIGGPKSLQELATRDLAGAQTFYDQVAIGDAWWRLSEGIRNGVYRQALLNRAASWYQKAWPVMPESLDRIHVKNRLDELDDIQANSPLTLIQQLADDLGVDLQTSLAAVNVRRVRRRGSNDQDDD
ncbi:DUF1559 domain-containing protein [Stieleria marina]|uniref:DUF1559 domain-containing protein n=1 Tax=Stieleria marina TaxID=1930275 RepID=A0A517NWG3_9BACT|nr:hypothetical protein K239x_34590 [Planctomycetes bacterium K23_9]